ncbi:MAG: TRAP transporter fused permease subunit [Dysosmobacter sp.]
MALFKKKEAEQAPPTAFEEHDTSVGTAADVEAVMKKYDRESNTRVWEGMPKLVIRWLMVAFSLYCIIDTVFLSTMQEIRLPVFVGLILLFGFLTFPARKGDTRVNHMPWYDIILLIIGPGAYFFYAVNAQNVIQMSARVMQNDLYMVIGLIGILALVELCRRCVGLPILCVAGALLVYTFFNLMGTPSADQVKMTIYQVIRTMFYTTNGIFGGPISVCAKFIVVFIIFGAFLERTGIAQFFISLANAVAGAAPGGPAKVAVISSALCGMVSGSSVGNTVTTGSVTIPMMKKTGYKGEFAGAVEAAASTGGQIMPPIMGAAAFLMAEFTGEPYSQIAVRAILPAVLYFTGIYIAVHLEAKKLGLQGIPRDQLPKMGNLMKKIYLLFPLVLLVILVSTNTFTMAKSAAIAIVAAVAVGLLNNVVDMTAKNVDRTDFLTFGKIWTPWRAAPEVPSPWPWPAAWQASSPAASL